MPTPALPVELCEEIRRRRGLGESQSKIARDLGIGRGTVSTHALGHCTHRTMPTENAAPPEPILDPVEEHRLKRELAEVKKKLQETVAARVLDERYEQFVAEVSSRPINPPDWLAPDFSDKHDAIATFLFSDWHFDEVVRPEQVLGMNAYNREIAEKRLRVYFENCIKVARDHVAGVNIESVVFAMAGDIFSGIIHAELKETNAATMCESFLYWLDPVVSGIRMLAGEFKSVYIPVVVGNHGRLSMKPVAKNRPQDNFDWLFGHVLRRSFADDDRVTFDVSNAADHRYPIYDTNYLLTHLDQFRGGTGISGLMAPMMLGHHRKTKREMAFKRPMDIMIGGHWHQWKNLGSVIINGTGKGYDEYAFQNNWEPEPPRQGFWLTQPNVGVTISSPIHVLHESESYQLVP